MHQRRARAANGRRQQKAAAWWINGFSQVGGMRHSLIRGKFKISASECGKVSKSAKGRD
jgi:hypothetical protein